MGSTYNLVVNGRTCQVTVDYEDTPLLYVLRNDLGLKAARFGCGTGQCGACTVLIDGHAQHACELPVWSLEGKAITTLEGLGDADRAHPLQNALIEFQAGQCGYCLSGIIMTAAELLANDPHPSREKIVTALDGNLCRCGSHNRIVRAIDAAAKKIAPEATSS